MGQRGHYSRYFWWASVRLDSDPLRKRSLSSCVEGSNADCDLHSQYIFVHPGLLEQTLILTAFPAFLIALTIVHGLAHFDVNEFLSFMLTMPALTIAWFYILGSLLDRWRYKRSLDQAPY
jgi:hypothetical protein